MASLGLYVIAIIAALLGLDYAVTKGALNLGQPLSQLGSGISGLDTGIGGGAAALGTGIGTGIQGLLNPIENFYTWWMTGK